MPGMRHEGKPRGDRHLGGVLPHVGVYQGSAGRVVTRSFPGVQPVEKGKSLWDSYIFLGGGVRRSNGLDLSLYPSY